MKVLTIHQTKTNLTQLLAEVDKGEQVVFGPRGQARYVISKTPSPKVDRSEALGYWKGQMWVADDAFSPETNEALWEEFWEEDIFDPNRKKTER